MPSVWITGASSGFGKHTALALAGEGWQVFASMRNLDKGKTLLDDAEPLGVEDQIIVVETDVTSTASVKKSLSSILDQSGGALDVLFNCAGHTTIGAFEDMTEAEYRGVMDTNFFGTLATTHCVLPIMRDAGHGRIVVVSSNAVNTPHPLMSLYAASKWAVEGWAEALALEVEPFGLKVAVVQPGAHKTPFGENTSPIMPEESAYLEWVKRATPGMQNLDRWGRDPHQATAAIVSAIRDPEPLFRYHIGEDARFFSWLKGACPFEVRAWVTRAIVGLPQKNAFTEKETPDCVAGNLPEIVERVIKEASNNPAFAADMLCRLASVQH